MRATRHAGRLLAATAICLVYPTPAVAGDYGITSEDATPVLIASGETVEGDKSGVYSTGTELNLTNEGTIRGNGLNAFTSNTDAGIAFKGGPATITNSGDISGAPCMFRRSFSASVRYCLSPSMPSIMRVPSGVGAPMR